MRRRRAVAVVVVMWFVAACGTGSQPSAELLAVATQDGPLGGSECPQAAIEGTLATSARWLLGVAGGPAGSVRGVLWPPGFAARRDDGRLVLLDEAHQLVAREGDRVRVGGEDGSDGVWLACRTVIVLPAA